MQETIHSPCVRTEGRKCETGCHHAMNCGSADDREPGQQSAPAECGPALSKGNPGEERRTKSSVVFCCCRHYLVRNRWHWSDGPSAAVETAIVQCTSRWAMARGHRLNTSIVLAAVHGLLGLPCLHSLAPSSHVPVPNKHSNFCGR